LLDAVAFVLDQRKGKINFSDDSSDVEASDVWEGLGLLVLVDEGVLTANTTLVSDFEGWADGLETCSFIALDWAGESGRCEQKRSRDDRSEKHFDLKVVERGWWLVWKLFDCKELKYENAVDDDKAKKMVLKRREEKRRKKMLK
jgi:hypothetical protein